jgi:hypothetical protein
VRRLARRVKNGPRAHAQAMAGQLPVGTSATPMTMPMSAVNYLPTQSYPWGTATYQDLHPLYTADGAMIPSIAQGSWGNLHAAGRP